MSHRRKHYKTPVYRAPPGSSLFDTFGSPPRSSHTSAKPTKKPVYKATSSSSLFDPFGTPPPHTHVTRKKKTAPSAKQAISSAPPTHAETTTMRTQARLGPKLKLATRRPKPGCEIAPSVFRPNVVAPDRLRAWITPFSEAQLLKASSKFSRKVVELGFEAEWAGLSDATKSSYAAGLLRFNQFCDRLQIPEIQRMPADQYLITGFIGYHLGKASNACVKGWLSGLRAWHDLSNAPWPSDSRKLRFARAGARVAGAHLKRPMRNPITIQHMLALYYALDFSIPFHCAIWAVACIAFWSCRRLGELTIPSRSKFNPRYHASRSTPISFAHNPDRSIKAVLFHIPWSKSSKELGADVTGTAQFGPLKIFCPVNAMQIHLQKNSSLPSNLSLFAYIDSSGKPQHMVKSVFLDFCHAAWDKKGLLRVQGHSFRIGGAVELLIAGVPPEIIAGLGGWSSLAFLIYWRRFEEIIPAHVFKAYDPTQISRLKRTLDDFRKQHNIDNATIDACVNGIDMTDFE